LKGRRRRRHSIYRIIWTKREDTGNWMRKQ